MSDITITVIGQICIAAITAAAAVINNYFSNKRSDAVKAQVNEVHKEVVKVANSTSPETANLEGDSKV